MECMERFEIDLCATISCITFYNLQQPPAKSINVGNAVSALQDLLKSSERVFETSPYNFLTREKISHCTGITDTRVLDQILAIWQNTPATNAPDDQALPPDTLKLFGALTKLLPSQFAMIEFVIGVPNAEQAPNTKPLVDRVRILLRYLAKQDGGVERLREELAKNYPGLLLP